MITSHSETEMSLPINLRNQQQDSIIQNLTRFQRITRRIAIVLTTLFTFEIIFIFVGYVGQFQLRVVSGFWFFWLTFYGIFVIITPFILIITLPSAGYFIFQYFKRNRNKRITLIVSIAAALNILALLSIFAFQKAAYNEAQKDKKELLNRQQDLMKDKMIEHDCTITVQGKILFAGTSEIYKRRPDWL